MSSFTTENASIPIRGSQIGTVQLGNLTSIPHYEPVRRSQIGSQANIVQTTQSFVKSVSPTLSQLGGTSAVSALALSKVAQPTSVSFQNTNIAEQYTPYTTYTQVGTTAFQAPQVLTTNPRLDTSNSSFIKSSNANPTPITFNIQTVNIGQQSQPYQPVVQVQTQKPAPVVVSAPSVNSSQILNNFPSYSPYKSSTILVQTNNGQATVGSSYSNVIIKADPVNNILSNEQLLPNVSSLSYGTVSNINQNEEQPKRSVPEKVTFQVADFSKKTNPIKEMPETSKQLENGGELFAHQLSYSYGNLSQAQPLNISRSNVSRVADSVSDKLIDEFQKLTEQNLKYFIDNKSKWQEVEDNLKLENENLKQRISMIQESRIQANQSQLDGASQVIATPFSLQNELEKDKLYEEKMRSMQEELTRKQREAERFKAESERLKNEVSFTEEKNKQLAADNFALNDKVQKTIMAPPTQIVKIVEKPDLQQLEEVKKQYEYIIASQREQMNTTIQNLKGDIEHLESDLIQEKFDKKRINGSLEQQQASLYQQQALLNHSLEMEHARQVELIVKIEQLESQNTKLKQANEEYQLSQLGSSNSNQEIQNELKEVLFQLERKNEQLQRENANLEEIKNRSEYSIRQEQEYMKKIEELEKERKLLLGGDDNIRNQLAIEKDKYEREHSNLVLLRQQLENLQREDTRLNQQIEELRRNNNNGFEKNQEILDSTVIQSLRAEQQQNMQIRSQVKEQEQDIAGRLEQLQSENKRLEALLFEANRAAINQSELQTKKLELLSAQQTSIQAQNEQAEVKDKIQSLTANTQELLRDKDILLQKQQKMLQDQAVEQSKMKQELSNLQNQYQRLNQEKEDLALNQEKTIQERTQDYRDIISRMEQEYISVIHPDQEDRAERDLRMQHVSQMDSILAENQIEELNETIKQLQYQLDVQSATKGENERKVNQNQNNLINIQENVVAYDYSQPNQYEDNQVFQLQRTQREKQPRQERELKSTNYQEIQEDQINYERKGLASNIYSPQPQANKQGQYSGNILSPQGENYAENSYSSVPKQNEVVSQNINKEQINNQGQQQPVTVQKDNNIALVDSQKQQIGKKDQVKEQKLEIQIDESSQTEEGKQSNTIQQQEKRTEQQSKVISSGQVQENQDSISKQLLEQNQEIEKLRQLLNQSNQQLQAYQLQEQNNQDSQKNESQEKSKSISKTTQENVKEDVKKQENKQEAGQSNLKVSGQQQKEAIQSKDDVVKKEIVQIIQKDGQQSKVELVSEEKAQVNESETKKVVQKVENVEEIVEEKKKSSKNQNEAPQVVQSISQSNEELEVTLKIVAELKQEIEKEKNARQEIETINNQKQQQINELQETLEKQTKSKEEIVSSLENQKAALEKQITENNQKESERATQEAEKIEQATQVANEEINKLKANLEEADKVKKTLHDQLFSFDEKEHALHKQLQEAKDEITKLHEEHQFKEREGQRKHTLKNSEIMNEHDMKINKMKADFEQSSQEILKQKQQAEQTLNEQLKDLNSQIAGLQETISQQNSQVLALEKKLEDKNQELEKKSQRMEEMIIERQELLKTDQDSEKKSQQFKEILEKETKLKIEKAEQDVKEQEKQHQETKDKLKVAQENLKKAQEKISEGEGNLKQAQEEAAKKLQDLEEQKGDLQGKINELQFEVKKEQSALENEKQERSESEHQLKNEAEKYQAQLVEINDNAQQKEKQLILYKKENIVLAERVNQVEEQLEKETKELQEKLEKLEKENQEYKKQIADLQAQFEQLTKEKENNDALGNEEIQKLKLNYEALLDSEKQATEDVRKEYTSKVDDLKVKLARTDSQHRGIEEKLQKQLKKLEKEVETVNHLNEKKIAMMKSIHENNHKLEAEKLELQAIIEKKDERIQEEANAAAQVLEIKLGENAQLASAIQQLKNEQEIVSQKLETYKRTEEAYVQEIKTMNEKIQLEKKSAEEEKKVLIKEYEEKITKKDQDFQTALSSKEDSSTQVSELAQKLLENERIFREKENALNAKNGELISLVSDAEGKVKALEEEKIKNESFQQEQMTKINGDIAEKNERIKVFTEKIEKLEKNGREKELILKNLENEKKDQDEKITKLTEKSVTLTEQVESIKAQKKEIEDKLNKKMKEKEVEHSIVASDYDEKIKVYRHTIEHLQNSRLEASNMSQDLKLSQISRITDNHSENNSVDMADKYSANELSARLGGHPASTSRISFTSQRSKEETRSMYKKLSMMSTATAAMMSAKHDYVSLKELAKSKEESDGQSQGSHSNSQGEGRLTRSEIIRK